MLTGALWKYAHILQKQTGSGFLAGWCNASQLSVFIVHVTGGWHYFGSRCHNPCQLLDVLFIFLFFYHIINSPSNILSLPQVPTLSSTPADLSLCHFSWILSPLYSVSVFFLTGFCLLDPHLITQTSDFSALSFLDLFACWTVFLLLTLACLNWTEVSCMWLFLCCFWVQLCLKA